MKFLFNEKDEITLDEIKKISKNDYNDFLYNYLKWKNSVKNDAINEVQAALAYLRENLSKEMQIANNVLGM